MYLSVYIVTIGNYVHSTYNSFDWKTFIYLQKIIIIKSTLREVSV